MSKIEEWIFIKVYKNFLMWFKILPYSCSFRNCLSLRSDVPLTKKIYLFEHDNKNMSPVRDVEFPFIFFKKQHIQYIE